MKKLVFLLLFLSTTIFSKIKELEKRWIFDLCEQASPNDLESFNFFNYSGKQTARTIPKKKTFHKKFWYVQPKSKAKLQPAASILDQKPLYAGIFEIDTYEDALHFMRLAKRMQWYYISKP